MPNEPLVLREMMIARKQLRLHLEGNFGAEPEYEIAMTAGRVWCLFAGDVLIAYVPSAEAFGIGWMMSDTRKLTLEPL